MPSTIRALPTLLSDQPLFRDLGREACQRISAGATISSVARGGFIFHSGAAYSGAHVVLSGKAKVARSARDGLERVVGLAQTGDTLGLECLSRESAYRASAQALQETRVLALPRSSLAAELKRNLAFAHAVVDYLSERLEESMHDLEICTLLPGRERVASFLLRNAGSSAERFTLPAAKGVVASRLNLTHEHFSRILRQLAEDGLIEVLGRTIAIRDRPRLRSAIA